MRSQTFTGNAEPLAAIILVGGRSSRMGRPKAWLDFAGGSLLTWVVDRVRPWAQEVVLVAAPGQDLPPLDGADTTGAGPPLTVVRDDHPGEGPLPALTLGLTAVGAAWAMALGCDAPLLRSDVVARLAEERGADVDAIIPTWDGRPQPLVALYRRTLAPTLAALVAAGERRLHAIATLPRVRLLAPATFRHLDPEGESFRSLNTPAEYAAAVAMWQATQRAGR